MKKKILIKKNEKKKNFGTESWKLATAQVYFREWELCCNTKIVLQ